MSSILLNSNETHSLHVEYTEVSKSVEDGITFSNVDVNSKTYAVYNFNGVEEFRGCSEEAKKYFYNTCVKDVEEQEIIGIAGF